MQLNINKTLYEVDVAPDTPLLWVLRDNLQLTGTKYSCGIGVCGACTVLMNGQPQQACMMSVSQATQYEVMTIEGLSEDGSNPVQLAWVEEDVSQCGYCQSGQILTAVALLADNANPTDSEIDSAMTNICRCGSYSRIRSAIKRVAAERGDS